MQNPWIQNLQIEIERADCVKYRWTAGHPGVCDSRGTLDHVVAGRGLFSPAAGVGLCGRKGSPCACAWLSSSVGGGWDHWNMERARRLWKNPVPLLFAPVYGRGITEVMVGGGVGRNGG